MKLQVAFDLTDLQHALKVAEQVHEYADIFEVGSLLIYKYGEHAIQTFKEKFPDKVILADAKIADRSKEAVALFAQAGTDWVTVMAGTNKHLIHGATQTAHELNKRVMLDLTNSSSPGQSALEAKSLGADALLLPLFFMSDAQPTISEQWDMVKGNTELPIFIAASIDKEKIHEILSLKPAGIVIGSPIVQDENPKEAAAYYYGLAHRSDNA